MADIAEFIIQRLKDTVLVLEGPRFPELQPPEVSLELDDALDNVSGTTMERGVMKTSVLTRRSGQAVVTSVLENVFIGK
jgi:hypothetical protein